ncbi:MAG: hypothetical protein ACQEP7_02700 [bacterium]
MGQHGHRNMYYQTGLPGWVRRGYSPGWGGKPPMASYLEDTGQLQDAQDWFQQNAATDRGVSNQAEQSATSPQGASTTETQQLKQQVAELQNQVQELQNQLDEQN